MHRLRKVLFTGLAVVGAIALLGAVAFSLGGVSAQPEPSRLESLLARAARHRLIPGSARAADNPVEATAEVLANGMSHWADHCASCHGNDGRGETALGRGLYPRAPDMTLEATQGLSDGELFWIIENGIRLTGMPGWGDAGPEDDEESWELVHFIRHLEELSDSEIREMELLNPVSRAELEHQMEIERFLAGESDAAPSEEAHD